MGPLSCRLLVHGKLAGSDEGSEIDRHAVPIIDFEPSRLFGVMPPPGVIAQPEDFMKPAESVRNALISNEQLEEADLENAILIKAQLSLEAIQVCFLTFFKGIYSRVILSSLFKILCVKTGSVGQQEHSI